MEYDAIKNDFLNTLDILQVKELPVLIEEVLNFYVTSDKSAQVGNTLVASKLKDLEHEGTIFINDEGFVSFSKDMNEGIKKRFELDENTKAKVKYTQKILRRVGKRPFIRFVGAIGDSPMGRIQPNEEIKLIVIVEKDTQYLVKFFFEMYLKSQFAMRNFVIERILEIDNIKWAEADAKNGLRLLHILPVINKDKTYESFMANNNWIFDIFSNYPLEKVSWGFRVSKHIETNLPGIYRKINAFLKPKE